MRHHSNEKVSQCETLREREKLIYSHSSLPFFLFFIFIVMSFLPLIDEDDEAIIAVTERDDDD